MKIEAWSLKPVQGDGRDSHFEESALIPDEPAPHRSGLDTVMMFIICSN